MAEGAWRQMKEVGGVRPLPTGCLQVLPGRHDMTAGRLFLQALEPLPGEAAPRHQFPLLLLRVAPTRRPMSTRAAA